MSDHVSNDLLALGKNLENRMLQYLLDTLGCFWWGITKKKGDEFIKESACLQAEIKWIVSLEIQGFAGL